MYRPTLLFIFWLSIQTVYHNGLPSAHAQVDLENLSLSALEEISLVAGELVFHPDSEQLSARGGVVLLSGQFRLQADSLGLHLPTGAIEARKARIHLGSQVLEAEKFSLSVGPGRLQLDEFRYQLLDKSNDEQSDCENCGRRSILLSASRLTREPDGRWLMEDVSFTLCDCPDGEAPSWRLTCSRAEIRENESAEFTRPVFRVKERPVFALPYLSLPLSKRRTGFLLPGFLYSERLGFRLQQEFFWAIRQNMDASFGLDAMTRRGVMPTMEFRYLTPRSEGAIDGFYLYDQQGDKSETPRHRFGLRAEERLKISPILHQKAKLELLSDTAARSDFLSRWQEREADFTESSFELAAVTDEIYASISLNYAQRLFDPMEPDGWLWSRRSNPAVQSLPALSFSLPGMIFVGGDLLLGLDTRIDFLYRPSEGFQGFDKEQDRSRFSETAYQSLRLETQPRIVAPINFDSLATLVIEGGVHHYTLFPLPNSPPPVNRGAAELGAEVKTRLYRIYGLASSADSPSPTRLKHSIEPRLSWYYAPWIYGDSSVDGELAMLTPLEAAQASHTASLTLGQRLVLKDADGKFHRFLDLDLIQRFFIDSQARDRFGSVLDDTSLRLRASHEYFSLTGLLDVRWSSLSIGSAGSRLDVGPFGGGRLSAAYRYLSEGPPRSLWLNQLRSEDETMHQIGIRPSWTFFKALTLRYAFDLAVDSLELIEQSWGLRYDSPCRCWSADLNVLHRPGMNAPDVIITFDFASLGEG